MVITYSGRSAPSARKIAEQSDSITLNRGSEGVINWGRNRANTELNPDISNSVNKRVMRQLFKEHGVPMPHLFTGSGEVNERLLAGHRSTVIGRPDRHSGGRGLWKITNPIELRLALVGTRRKKAATHFMEFIDAPREYRVHIFKGKSIRLSEKRHGETGDTAHGDYITVRPNPEHNIRHVREAAKKAVEALGLDFGTVDVLADNDNCWVLEVNTAAGLGGSMPRVWAETFLNWYEGERNGS